MPKNLFQGDDSDPTRDILGLISRIEEQKAQEKKVAKDKKQARQKKKFEKKIQKNVDEFLDLFKKDKEQMKGPRSTEREYLVNCFYDVLTEGFLALDEAKPSNPYTFLVSVTRVTLCMSKAS